MHYTVRYVEDMKSLDLSHGDTVSVECPIFSEGESNKYYIVNTGYSNKEWTGLIPEGNVCVKQKKSKRNKKGAN